MQKHTEHTDYQEVLNDCQGRMLLEKRIIASDNPFFIPGIRIPYHPVWLALMAAMSNRARPTNRPGGKPGSCVVSIHKEP
jgi:hypothetical protein